MHTSGKNGQIKVAKPPNKNPPAAVKTYQPSKKRTTNISQDASIDLQGAIPISNGGEETHQLDTEITECIEVETSSEDTNAMIWLETEMESPSVVVIPDDDIIINGQSTEHQP